MTTLLGYIQKIGKFVLTIRKDETQGWYYDIHLWDTMDMVESSRWLMNDETDEVYYETDEICYEHGKSMCEYMEKHGHPMEQKPNV